MRLELLGIDTATYQPHPLHATERTWMETNCYVDLWIELLHALDLDPIACSAFTLSTDFEGDQWTFFKFPPEDLRALYGIEVSEMNVWRPVLDHVVEQLELGRLLTVEVDSWYLPDTHGVSYQIAHVKSTIVPQMVDADARELGYFHNAGYFELSGENFDGIFRLGAEPDPSVLPPYVESVRLDRIRRDTGALVSGAVRLTREHLSRRSAADPMVRFEERLRADLPWLAAQDLETFHQYAFGTCRQCGASAELAATFVDWLDAHDGGGLSPTADAFRTVAEGAKGLQFALARVARGREVDLHSSFELMGQAWEEAMTGLDRRYGD